LKILTIYECSIESQVLDAFNCRWRSCLVKHITLSYSCTNCLVCTFNTSRFTLSADSISRREMAIETSLNTNWSWVYCLLIKWRSWSWVTLIARTCWCTRQASSWTRLAFSYSCWVNTDCSCRTSINTSEVVIEFSRTIRTRLYILSHDDSCSINALIPAGNFISCIWRPNSKDFSNTVWSWNIWSASQTIFLSESISTSFTEFMAFFTWDDWASWVEDSKSTVWTSLNSQVWNRLANTSCGVRSHCWISTCEAGIIVITREARFITSVAKWSIIEASYWAILNAFLKSHCLIINLNLLAAINNITVLA